MLVGTHHPDSFYGEGGDDYLDGGEGYGPDQLVGGWGGDTLMGRGGDDTIKATVSYEQEDGAMDYIDCGPGDRDVAVIDATTIHTNCEIIHKVKPYIPEDETTGGATGGGTGSDVAAPRVTVRAASPFRLGTGNGANVTVTCSEVCTIRGTAKALLGSQSRTIVPKPVAAGVKAQKVGFVLPHAFRRAIRNGRTVTLKVRLRTSDRHGNATTNHAVVRVRR